MGYYDFEEHFWSPQEVCGQMIEPVNETRFKFGQKIVKAIRSAWRGNKELSPTWGAVEASHHHWGEEC